MTASAQGPTRSSGTLYVVGTPIGNLSDITLRAVEILRTVDRVAAEDTRRTRALLSHLDIRKKPLSALNAHASERNIRAVVDHLQRGQSVALVTDAGMPTISDPGAKMVRAAIEEGLGVMVAPGPSAVTAAISLSGLVDGPFVFLGFLPRRGQKRARAITRIAGSPEPVILFEAPRRTHETLQDLAKAAPDRSAAVCRELTKLHEETHRGSLAELSQVDAWRGEVTIVIGAAPATSTNGTEPEARAQLDQRIIDRLRSGATVKTTVAELSASTELSRRNLYARVQELREQLQREG